MSTPKRELKFRAWDGDCYHCSDEYNNLTSFFFNMIDIGCADFEQYTGLKDKNGKDIYEGDQCKALGSGVDGFIVWHNGRFCWTDGGCHWDMIYNSPRDNQPTEEVVDRIEDIEIMGNIHENPELLEAT